MNETNEKQNYIVSFHPVDKLSYEVSATNEDEAVANASGLWLAEVMMKHHQVDGIREVELPLDETDIKGDFTGATEGDR